MRKHAGPEYLGQVGPGMCCIPIAMCNALRFWGLPSPEPGTSDWETMVDIAGCRHGSAIGQQRTADWLGLVSVPTSLHFLRHGQMLPALVTVRSPDGGLHAALVIEIREGEEKRWPDLRFVNYRYDTGPLLEWVPWHDAAWDSGNREEDEKRWLVPRWRHGEDSEVTEC